MKMLTWQGLVVVIALNAWQITATNNHFTNSSSPVVSYYATTSSVIITSGPVPTTTNSRDGITSCAPPPLEYFIAESLRTLPFTQQFMIFQTALAKYAEYFLTVADIKASGITNAAASSYFNSVLREIRDDVPRLFGPGGYAFLLFQDIRTDGCLYSTCFDQYFDQSSAFRSVYSDVEFTYYPSAPCCDRCKLTADNVDLEYWPTPAPNPEVKTLVDEADNFTYVSPSVYARYTNLYARDLCGFVGTYIPSTRLAFGPTDLTSSYFEVPVADDVTGFAETFVDVVGEWKQINYADFDSPNCLCTTNCPVNPANNVTATYTCKPRLSIHPRVSALDPLWATCRDDLYGFFDPPIALSRRAGLTEPRTTIVDSTPPGPNPTPTPTAPSPVDSPRPPTGTPSTTPGPVPEPVTRDPSSSAPSPVIPSTVPAGPSPVNPGVPVPPNGGNPTTLVTVIGTQTFVIGPSASTVVVEGSTFALPGIIPPNQGADPITINGQVLTPNADSNVVIGSQTLTPGGPAITVSGTVISLSPGGSAVVLATSAAEGDVGTPAQSSSTTAEFTGSASRQMDLGNFLMWSYFLLLLLVLV